MAAQDTKIIKSKNEDSTESKNLFEHFTNFLLKFSPPLFKQETEPVQQREAEAILLLPVDDDANESNKVVKFSDPKPIIPPPLKLEVPDSEQNPAARYLVYAVGGLIVMSWVWAKWGERKGISRKKDSSSDNHGSSPAD